VEPTKRAGRSASSGRLGLLTPVTALLGVAVVVVVVVVEEEVVVVVVARYQQRNAHFHACEKIVKG
jgi:hypothetical protein